LLIKLYLLLLDNIHHCELRQEVRMMKAAKEHGNDWEARQTNSSPSSIWLFFGCVYALLNISFSGMSSISISTSSIFSKSENLSIVVESNEFRFRSMLLFRSI